MSYLDEHLDFLARHEGTKGAKTRVEDKTKPAAPYGLDNPPIPRKNNESDRAYAKRVLEFFDAKAANVLGDSYSRAPKKVKRAVLDSYYNSGRLYPGQINSLKNDDYLGFAKNTLDIVSAEDPKTGGSGVLRGLANRRAETYNLMADDVEGLPRITGGELVDVDGKARLVYDTTGDPYTFNFQKPRHSDSDPGKLRVPGSQQTIDSSTSLYDKGLGAIQQFRNYLGFKKGGDVNKTTTPMIDVSDRLPYDRLQEMARRSMMLGNEQDRMEDYDYARLLAEKPDARSAYSTAAPMGMQAQRMMGFAEGGMVDDAQGLASLGRGGDSMLVHMQPQEVAGLQRLAEQSGTSLTKNPYTGMPEAFNLGGVFRAAVPIAAGYFTGGAGYGLGSQIAAGALSGGALAAATGQDPIMGTVSGGMGGVSGAGLNQALMGPGGGFNPFATETAPLSNTAGTYSPALKSAPQMTQGPAFSNMNPGASTYDKIATNLGTQEMRTLTDLSNLPKDYQMVDGKFMAPTGKITPASPLQVGMKLGSPVASALMGGIEESDLMPSTDYLDDAREKDRYDPTSQLDLSMDTGIAEALKRDSGLRLLAQGGYLDGGHIGDGMSDSVRANIDGQQQARLSEGEFVIPADVVSHLGNGSSDAGAQRLYSMMDRVRKARTGTEQQGRQIDPRKYMPR